MNTYPASFNTLLTYGLGGDTFQAFVDHYNERYNKLEIDGFGFAPNQLGYTWQQLVSNVATAVLPTYVDPESDGYEMPLGSVEGQTGNIPTFKSRYRLNRVAVRERMQLMQRLNGNLSGLTEDFTNVFMGLIDEGVEAHIKSYDNALTNQRHQIVSTGQFTINVNNPRGYKNVVISFGVPAGNKDTLTGNARWWTSTTHTTANEGSSSDPIGYLKNKVKSIRRVNHYIGKLRMEISRDLLEDMLTHSAVLKQIGLVLYPAAASDSTGATAIEYAKNVTDDLVIETLRKIIRVDSIVARDSWAYVSAPGTNADGEPDLVTTAIQNFDPKNVSFIPEGNIGDFMGVEPLTLGYDDDKVASYHGGRLKLQLRAEPNTHSIYIDSEAAQIAVPNQPQYMFICTVTA